MMRCACLLSLVLLMAASARAQEDAQKKEARARIDSLEAKVGELYQSGKYADARSLAEQAVKVAEEQLGPGDPDTAGCLHNLALLLKAMGDPRGARPLLERALAIDEKALGPEHPYTARALDDLASLEQLTGDFKGARPLFERALALREKAFGPDHTETARCLNNLGMLLKDMGDLQGAKPLLERALATNEKVLGAAHPLTAASLNNLGCVLQAVGDLKGAKPLFERALAIREKALGPDHPDTATTLGNLASLLEAAGDLGGARSLFERALAIDEKALGPDSPETTQALENLAQILQAMGDLDGARPLYERALGIDEKVQGPDHTDTAVDLNNLASLLEAMGDLSRARSLFERALAIWEKTRGPDHSDTASGLYNLANLLKAMGDLDGARPLCERALAIWERALGPDHPQTTKGLNSLALLLQAMGDLKSAKPLYERALAARERVLGPDHPDTAMSLNNLGFVLHAMGDLKGARPLYERALAIQEKALGEEHPDTATSLNNLAEALQAMGDVKAARPLYERALAIREKVQGPDNPETAMSLNNLAGALHALGDDPGARLLYERAWTSNRRVLHLLLPALSSRERCALVQDRAQQLGYYLCAFPDEPSKTYEAACAWKGAALRANAAAQRLPADAPVEARRVVDDLAAARGEMARLMLTPRPPRAGEPSVAERYERVRERLEGLERRLAEIVPDFAARALLDVKPSQVQQSLPDGAVLLEMLECRGNVHAWVLRREGDVKYFAVGSASDLEALAQGFRDALEREDRKAWSRIGAALREWLGRPLSEALAGATTLYLAPDGALATVPFGLLPDGDGFLLERIPIVTVNGGAWMAVSRLARPAGPTGGLLAFGGVDYGGLGRELPPLPATQEEVKEVAARFASRFPKEPARVLTGKEASKTAFLAGAGKARYVHVATHGFFDLEHLRAASARGFSGMASRPLESSSQGTPVGGWNPLLLSGIVLAKDAKSDGWLTAEEVQSLDLTGVELVALSACDTGRGELAAGEGVMGLSRALSVAGARGFLLSLWEVPDAATRDLMDGFYAGMWGNDPLTADAALRDTQIRMLRADREKNAFRPRSWGAWILIR